MKPDDIKRSQQRAKTRVRQLVTEMRAETMMTLATRRGFGGKVDTRQDMLGLHSSFWRRVLRLDPRALCVVVPEPFPSCKAHFHLHCAVRTRLHVTVLRRLWYATILADRGLPANTNTDKENSPGSINLTFPKRFIGSGDERALWISRYIAKYMTKDDDKALFNRKRYWSSKAIALMPAVFMWLAATNQLDAICEARRLLGYSGTVEEAAAFILDEHPFMPNEKIVHWHEPPPF